MPRWVPVATSDDVDRRPRRVGGPPPGAHGTAVPAVSDTRVEALTPLSRPLVLLRRVDGVAVAVVDGCPHLGTSLAAAEVDGNEVTCPAHVYSYDLTSGDHTTPGSPLAGHLELLPVRERDGVVEVDLETSDASEVVADVDGDEHGNEQGNEPGNERGVDHDRDRGAGGVEP